MGGGGGCCWLRPKGENLLSYLQLTPRTKYNLRASSLLVDMTNIVLAWHSYSMDCLLQEQAATDQPR